ncbi:XRE family transcriptional regulator [Geothrix sp. 21YS21S-2]|uniref:XRE family transcriptional regulator n=1 Tax=Geothrix sp. 21YS21S-2 TaxID=3068893 RepID=UPI0027BA6778|nr:XRE family transcriptional regulator [Geothrix sp. 21YS21S-2]
MPEAMELGRRVATFRERLGLSREELAANAGVSAGLVEAVEEGRAYPPLGLLLKVARALGQRLGTFMDDHYREDPLIVRAKDRQGEVPDAVTGPYRYFSLGRGKTDRHMEPLFIEIGPEEPGTPSSHEGEEFLLVADGEVVVRYGNATHTLRPGDTMYYNSIVPHVVFAGGGRPASIYAVIFQPF